MTNLEAGLTIPVCIWSKLLLERSCIYSNPLQSPFCRFLYWPHLSVFCSQVLKGSKKLSMSVCSMGRIPGGYVTNHVYTWVDPQGRSVSPPPDLVDQRGSGGRHSDIQQLGHTHICHEDAEKKVSVKESSWWQINWNLRQFKIQSDIVSVKHLRLFPLRFVSLSLFILEMTALTSVEISVMLQWFLC